MIWRAACHRKLALKYIKSALAITHRGKVSLRLFLFHALATRNWKTLQREKWMKILALMMVARHQAMQRGLLLAKLQADLHVVLIKIECH